MIDEVDCQIITRLQEDARLSNAVLARETGFHSGMDIQNLILIHNMLSSLIKKQEE